MKPGAKASCARKNKSRSTEVTRARLLRLGGILGFLAAGALLFWVARPLGISSFDEKRAFGHLKAQWGFGPRVPGTQGHGRCLDYITRELKACLPQVHHHRFKYKSALLGVVQGTNVWAISYPAHQNHTERVLLCAHWDTRPVAERDPEPSRRSLPVPGANDGASGVAVLLEVARILGRNPPPVHVDILLFDMEDLGGLPISGPEQDPFCVGSSRFVEEHPEFKADYGILLDMVGKKNLKITKEAISLERAPQVVQRVWAVARRLGIKAFSENKGPAVFDDHVPFLEKGIPVINLIDMDYPPWHTAEDNPEHCSPQSLKQVGEVILGVLYGK